MCREAEDIVEVGKCKDCSVEVISVDDRKNAKLVKEYGISAVPSIVIDGKIKVVGVPEFPWFCGDEFYRRLEMEFPLEKGGKRRVWVSRE